jgi:hypothetical protein
LFGCLFNLSMFGRFQLIGKTGIKRMHRRRYWYNVKASTFSPSFREFSGYISFKGHHLQIAVGAAACIYSFYR